MYQQSALQLQQPFRNSRKKKSMMAKNLSKFLSVFKATGDTTFMHKENKTEQL